MNIWVKAGLVAGVGVAGIGMAAATFAAQGGHGRLGGPEMSFETLDADGDGLFTIQEARSIGTARFGAMDADGDGLLSRDEIVAASLEQMRERLESQIERMIQWQDTDGDGLLSEAEMPAARMGAMFQRLDTDGDGAVSAEEFAAARERGEGRRGLGKRHGPRNR